MNTIESAIDSLLLISYDERWKKYRAQYKSCRKEFSGEAVHDLRVTARRMLAMLDIARGLVPHPRVQKARKELKAVIDQLDELRDVQVMLVEISDNIELLPELKSFQKALTKREAKLFRAAYKHVKQNGLSELSRRVRKTREDLAELEAQDADFRERLLEVADNAHASARQASEQVDSAQPSTIHNLRIVFKKFRYLAEIVTAYAETYPAENFERMHHYQDVMGNIQDAEVFLTSFVEYTEEHAADLKKENVIKFYRKKLHTLIEDFIRIRAQLNSFWKTNSSSDKEKEK